MQQYSTSIYNNIYGKNREIRFFGPRSYHPASTITNATVAMPIA